MKSFQGDTASCQVVKPWNNLLLSGQPVTVPQHSHIEIDIVAEEYSTGYLQFSFSGGFGCVVRHLSAESYEKSERKPRDWNLNKGDRMDFQNGYLNGNWDSYVVAGRESESHETFWFRTFRILRVNLRTKDEALVISDISYRQTNYPLEIQG